MIVFLLAFAQEVKGLFIIAGKQTYL